LHDQEGCKELQSFAIVCIYQKGGQECMSGACPIRCNKILDYSHLNGTSLLLDPYDPLGCSSRTCVDLEGHGQQKKMQKNAGHDGIGLSLK
jgi:hypothetical protein